MASLVDTEASAWTPNQGNDGTHSSSRISQSMPSSVHYRPYHEEEPATPGFNTAFWLYLALLLLGLYWIYTFVAARYASYKQKQDILDRRRRAGIPDGDQRPFEVAYASAALRRREETQERMKEQAEQAERLRQHNSEWAQLGRTMGVPATGQAFTKAVQPRYDGLVQRFPSGQQQAWQPAAQSTAYEEHRAIYQSQPSRYPLATYNGIPETPTISSDESPTNPPPTWADRYAPPEVQIVNQRLREQAAATISTLGRRSRKQLVLDDDAQSETADTAPLRSRRRLDQWGNSDAIDGDNAPKWLAGQHNANTMAARTRKRGNDENSDVDDEAEEDRVKSKRKVVQPERERIPGAMPPPPVPVSALAGKGKRKAQPEDGQELPQRIKEPKRVRVLSRPVSEIIVDADMGPVEEEAAPEESIRKSGDEWESDGVRFKMGKDGQELREAFVKEQKTVTKQTGRYSPTKHVIVQVTKRWLSPDEYSRAEAAGNLTTEFDADAIVAEFDQRPSRAGSETGSEWGSVQGQTPLKTGGLRTGLGSDHPAAPFPALSKVKVPVEESRLNHVSSPRKNGMFGRAGSVPSRPPGMSHYERKKAEAEALTALRQARSKQKAEEAKAAAPVPAARPTVVATASAPAVPSFNPGTTKPAPAIIITPANVVLSNTDSASTSQDARKPVADAPKLPVFAFTSATSPQTTQEPAKTATEAPKTSFSFGTTAPAPTTTPATTIAPPAAPTASAITGTNAPAASTTTTGFSFGKPSSTGTAANPFSLGGAAIKPTSESKETQPAATPASTQPPLFGAPSNATLVSTSPLINFTADTKPTSTGFSFGSSLVPSNSSSNLFGTNTQSNQPTSTPADPTSFSLTPSTSTPAPTANQSNTSRVNATAGSNSFASNTAVPNSFSFGSNGTFGAAASTAPKTEPPAAAPTSDSGSKFGFNFGGNANNATSTANSSNVFGGFGAPKAEADKAPVTGFSIRGAAGNPSTGGTLAVEIPKPEPPKAFSFGQASTPTVNAFGQTPAPTPTAPAFGLSASSSTAPVSNAFGSPAGAPKTFTFGNSSVFGQNGATNSAGGSGASSPFPFGQQGSGLGGTSSPFAFNQSLNGAPAANGTGTPPTNVFKLGTPPPQNRPSKPMPRARR